LVCQRRVRPCTIGEEVKNQQKEVIKSTGRLVEGLKARTTP